MAGERTIIVLAGDRERPFLEEFLRERDGAIRIETAKTPSALRDVVARLGGKARIISFLNDLIVPADVLEALTIAPYNVHPGPPEYPGVHPESFAIWEDASQFGVTAHEITAKIDEGPIVALSRFDMPENADRAALSDMTLRQALKVFAVVAAHCVESDEPMPKMDERWSGEKRTKNAFATLCRSYSAASQEEQIKLRRACAESLESHAAA